MSDEYTEDDMRAVIDEYEYQKSMASYPETPPKDDIYKVFREVVGIDAPRKQTKLANLERAELGRVKVPVRAYLHLSTYAKSEGYDEVSRYLEQRSGDVSEPTLGVDSKWMDLLISIKRETKAMGPPRIKKSTGLFGTKEEKVGMTT